MRNRIIAYNSIFIGLAVIFSWIVLLTKQQMTEGKIESVFHLTSEFLMAVVCIVSEIFLLRNFKYAKR